MTMTVAELIEKLRALPPEASIGAVPSWGVHKLYARINGAVVNEVEIPTDPDVWPTA